MAAFEPITAAVLCGGTGRRMGGANKGQLVVGGRSILNRLVDTLRPLTPHLMLIDRDAAGSSPSGVLHVHDLVEESGALGGIYTALAAATTLRVIVVACDMPFVTTPFLTWMAGYAEDADVVIPIDRQGRHPLCGVFHQRITPALKARLDAGLLRVDDALEGLDVRKITPEETARFDDHGQLLLNVNTPAEYIQATSGYDTP